MMRKFTTYLFICTLCCCVSACDDDEVSAPPMPSFTVDKTSGMANDTEFTFVVDEVNADAVTLLPYGVENEGKAGILVKSFTSGKATVKVVYNDVGTFNAVVVASNFTNDGESIERTVSSPVAITITSDRNQITAFGVAGATDVDIDQTAQTIIVTVPYGTNVATLKPTFTVPPFSAVTIGGTAQTSGTSVVNFTNPVTYRVTAHNAATRDYVVTVNVTPAENINTIKSFSGTQVSDGADDREMPGFVGDDVVVLYDTFGTPDSRFDSIRVAYELTGAFAALLYGADTLEQDSLLNLTASKTLVVDPQDPAGATKTYTLYATDAPKLNISFNALNPDVDAVTEDFTIHAYVLQGTDVETLLTTATTQRPAGVTVVSITANGNPIVAGTPTPVDFSEPVKFVLTVADANLGITYQVTYTASVTVTP